MGYRLIDYKGIMAATLGWATNQTKPQKERRVLVSRIPALQYNEVIGSVISDMHGNVGKIWRLNATRPLWIDLTDWEEVLEIELVKKPRRGKRQGMAYDWEWKHGRWQRTWTD